MYSHSLVFCLLFKISFLKKGILFKIVLTKKKSEIVMMGIILLMIGLVET
jgi:hypothetical protein